MALRALRGKIPKNALLGFSEFSASSQLRFFAAAEEQVSFAMLLPQSRRDGVCDPVGREKGRGIA